MCILKIYIIIVLLKQDVFSQCYPAEEGKQHTILFNLDNVPSTLIFRIATHNSYVTKCTIETLSCTNEIFKQAVAHLRKNAKDSFSVNITIFKATRSNDFGFEGRWILTNDKDNTEFNSCELKLYAKPTGVKCKSYVIDDILHLTCMAEKIYPEAKCMFFTNYFDMNKTLKTIPVNYKHDVIQKEPVEYRSLCSIVLSKDTSANQTHTMLISMFPNVTGQNTDMSFGTNTTHAMGQFDLILRGCPSIIEIGAIVACSCESFNLKHQNNFSIVWKDESQDLLHDTYKIQFMVSRNSIKYTCLGKTDAGIVNPEVIYEPTVYIRPFNLTCRRTEGEMRITCKALGIYPIPRCLFIAYDHKDDVMMKGEATPFNTEIHAGNITQYKPECSINISSIPLNQDWRVVVIMYPNITGQDNDVVYGANVTVMLDTTSKIENCLEEKGKSTEIICIALPISSAFIILCLAVIFKKKRILLMLRNRSNASSNNTTNGNDIEDNNNDRLTSENTASDNQHQENYNENDNQESLPLNTYTFSEQQPQHRRFSVYIEDVIDD